MTCSICGNIIIGHGNNAQPVNDGRCCNDCNLIVIMERIGLPVLNEHGKRYADDE